MKQILDQLEQLESVKKDNKLSTGRLNPDPVSMTNHPELLERINTFLPADGWISYQSSVEQFQSMSVLPDITNETGLILQAELVQTGDSKKSLHIRQNGTGGWIINTITQIENNDTETGILEKSKYITMPSRENKTEGCLHYQTYWQLNENGEGYQKNLSRLVKIEINDVESDQEKNHGDV